MRQAQRGEAGIVDHAPAHLGRLRQAGQGFEVRRAFGQGARYGSTGFATACWMRRSASRCSSSRCATSSFAAAVTAAT